MRPYMYTVSVPVFIRALGNLKTVLQKGEAHAIAAGIGTETILTAQLAPDMYNLTRQVQIATDNAKGISARLAGLEPPVMVDTETTFADLYTRIDNTIVFLQSLDPQAFVGSETRRVAFPYAEGKHLLGEASLLQLSLPNFFFHAVTAYAILRNQEVVIGKQDFIGALDLKDN